jgi:hypothetical protein
MLKLFAEVANPAAAVSPEYGFQWPRYLVWELLLGVVITVALSLSLGEVAARELSGYAFVNDDGTLHIRKRTVHLFGISIPPTAKTCEIAESGSPLGSEKGVRCVPYGTI